MWQARYRVNGSLLRPPANVWEVSKRASPKKGAALFEVSQQAATVVARQRPNAALFMFCPASRHHCRHTMSLSLNCRL